MKTTLTIKWHDGKSASAIVTNEMPLNSDPVTWSGDLDRLNDWEEWKKADSYGLEVFFENRARTTRGTVTVKRDGEWPDIDDLNEGEQK